MPKYVALLRAINVGGHTVKMDHLRNLFEAIGHANVKTFIASGNVIFDSKSKDTQALERKIEKHLREALGYEVKTFVRSIAELAVVANYKPFSDSELNTHALYVGFVAESPGAVAKQKLLSLTGEVDDLHIHGREVYWLCRAIRMTDSKFSGALAEKILGTPATFRNSTTVKKLPPGMSSAVPGGKMLFMVIEHFKNSDPTPVYERYREQGRMMPDGLSYVDSWVEPDFARCFQLMECDDPQLLQQWTGNWQDLVDFEIVPVITSREAAEAVTQPVPLTG